MRRNSLDLLLVMLLVATSALVRLSGMNDEPARAILTAPLVLILPGYALSAALFSGPALDLAERSALSLGLSLATAVLAGFVLNWTPWGLQSMSWTVLLSGLTLGASVVAFERRRRGPDLEALVRQGIRLGIGNGLLLVLAAAIVAGAFGVARVGAERQTGTGFTQLWILPAGGAEPAAFQVGIRSMEVAPAEYRLVLMTESQEISEWPSIALEPGQQWQATTSLSGGESAVGPVEATLYRVEAPDTVYRRVTLWPQPSQD